MANQIHANTDWLNNCANQLREIEDSIRAAQDTLSGITLRRDEGRDLRVGINCSLRLVGGHYSGSNAQEDIRQLARAAQTLSRRVGVLSNGAANAARAFEEAENAAARLIGGTETGNDSEIYAGQGASQGGASGLKDWAAPMQGRMSDSLVAMLAASATTSLKWSGDDVWNLIKSFFGAGGQGGGLIMKTADFYKKIFSGKAGVKDFLKYMVSGVKTAVSWDKWHRNYVKLFNFGNDYGTKLYAKKLFGLDKYLKKPSAAKHWKDAFSTNFNNQFTKGITSKATWVFSGITAGIDNISEGLKKHYTWDRVGVEWAVETATTVAVTSAATAAVGAGLAAVGAPVIVVGGIAAAGICGVDWVVKNTIGGGEYGLIDGVGHLAGEGYEAAKKGIGSLVNKIKKGAKASWNYAMA